MGAGCPKIKAAQNGMKYFGFEICEIREILEVVTSKQANTQTKLRDPHQSSDSPSPSRYPKIFLDNNSTYRVTAESVFKSFGLDKNMRTKFQSWFGIWYM